MSFTITAEENAEYLAIIEFGFRKIRRILRITEGVIYSTNQKRENILNE